MNHLSFIRVSCAAALMVSECAFAQSMTYATAGELRDDCAAIPAMLRGERQALSAAGECIAFIDGVRALAHVIQVQRGLRVLCVPDRVTTVELAAVFVRAVDEAPLRRVEAAGTMLYQTFAEVFPCPSRTPPGRE